MTGQAIGIFPSISGVGLGDGAPREVRVRPAHAGDTVFELFGVEGADQEGATP